MERGGKGRYGERLKAMIENDHTLNVTLFMLILPTLVLESLLATCSVDDDLPPSEQISFVLLYTSERTARTIPEKARHKRPINSLPKSSQCNLL